MEVFPSNKLGIRFDPPWRDDPLEVLLLAVKEPVASSQKLTWIYFPNSFMQADTRVTPASAAIRH